ncbi:16S rRNA (guanine(527)-N(7))-methyltransferase RsmG [Roseovarius salinarum]|uniref:16S rRNA (guanine(527)-N(7))-methyltransferase RsmG n=1 Tax=Roseovarius salinarum TaxID=1981892 RepID=UPI000C340CCA|nr:16S rRNA (guanine(527)-N(7))-methyltransferase RsmG [Roseovarius salinarum]
MNGGWQCDVSRETSARLDRYEELLRKWNRKINLVAPGTLDSIGQRHIQDSAQLLRFAPPGSVHWLDLGAGGGFPGLVIAILAMESGNPRRVTLVESDQRKAVFLRTVIRETGAPADVIAERIEDLQPMNADVLSARALAPLDKLLGHAERHLKPGGVAIFPKGARWREELARAQSQWHFHHEVAKSETEPLAVILRITGVARD